MNICELRIGNIIKARDNGKWNTVMVSCIFPTFIIAKNRYIHLGNTYDAHLLHGAYLDQDWLFENDFHAGNVEGKITFELPGSNNDIRILVENECKNEFSIISVDDYGSYKKLSRTFSYFHELQNIYYEVTGDELFTQNSIKPILAMAAPIIDNHTESEQ